jgi:hypothetical protein
MPAFLKGYILGPFHTLTPSEKHALVWISIAGQTAV